MHHAPATLPLRRWSLAVAAVALVLTAVVGASPATAQDPSDFTDGSEASSDNQLSAEARGVARRSVGARASLTQSLEAYWTPERMRNATPVEESRAFRRAADNFQRLLDAEEKAAEQGVRPKSGPQMTAPVEFEGTAAPRARAGKAASDLRRYDPNLPSSHQTARNWGKVFFSDSSGGNYACSATIVNSEGKDMVWTAGHCVHQGDGGSWYRNWVFVPAYDDDLANPRPYGTWSARFLSSRNAWINDGDLRQDMGVATMNTRFGQHIVDVHGGQGFSVNAGKNVYARAMGYPAQTPFDGGNLEVCFGTTSPTWDVWFTWSQKLEIPCTMNKGASGGGWVINHSWSSGMGNLNGINSTVDRVPNATEIHTPYFDGDALSLYNFTRHN